jgi:hypothetical protein
MLPTTIRLWYCCGNVPVSSHAMPQYAVFWWPWSVIEPIFIVNGGYAPACRW